MRQIVLCTIATAFLCAFLGDSAQAQPTRVFVAAQGLDSNPCTFAQPCRTFQKGHDTVAANGEIDVLDPAGYGALIISKAISIQGHGFAGLAVPVGDGITINALANDKISLRGLLLDGVGSGLNGIVFNTGLLLDVQECLIRNFLDNGVVFAPSATSSLFVTNSILNSNGGSGIIVAGGGSPSGVIDYVVIERNGWNGGAPGLWFQTGPASTLFTVSNSVIAHSPLDGVRASSGGSPTALMLQNVVVSNNLGGDGVFANGPAVIRITKSTITGNAFGLFVNGGGQIISGGDNFVNGNGTDGAPTSTPGLK